MLIQIIQYIKGYIKIRLVGYSPERFINLCSYHDILLWNIENAGDDYEMYITIKGFRKLKPILKKTKTKVVILDKCGLPFFLHKYRKRKMFFIGIVLCAAMLYVMSLFIWDIHIEGNYTQTSDVILDYLSAQKVYHGISKKKVDCQEVESMIRAQFNDIIWASAEIRGTRLLIHVRENTDTDVVDTVQEQGDDTVTDLIADKDGLITKMITRAGTPQVKVGDVVKEGDLLVLGRVDVLGDDATVVNYQFRSADADIYAKTVYEYSDEFPLAYTDKNYSGEHKFQVGLQILQKQIRLFQPKIPYPSYDIVTDEYPLKIGENFYLPLTLQISTVKDYTPVEKTYTQEEADAIAQLHLSEFLEKLRKKGVQIVENNVKIGIDGDFCKAAGKLLIEEKIGARTPTEMLTIPEPEERTEEE